MNVTELISSGKLELYVAGSLPSDEMKEVADAIARHPEVAEEVNRIEAAIVALYASYAQPLSTEEMNNQVRAILRSESDHSLLPVTPPAKQARLISMSRFAVAAMVTGLVLSLALAGYLGMQYNRLRDEVAGIRGRQEQMVQENDKLKKESQILETRFNVMKDILTKRVELKFIPGNKFTSDNSFIVVYWHPPSQKLMVANAQLPDLPTNEQYQLWALLGNQQVDLGVFDTRNGQVPPEFMKNIDAAQGFAVTVEPRGGSKTPTLSNICMMAKM